MHPAVIVLLLAALAAALLLGSPHFRARLAVWRLFRQEEVESRDERRPPRRHVEAYHRAIVAQGLGVQGTGTHGTVADGMVAPGTVAPATYIDDRTWADLDLNEIYSELDHTKSRPGQQYLRHLLRTPQTPDALRHLHKAVEELRGDEPIAKAVRKALSNVDDPRASYLVDLIFGELPDRPALWWVFPLLTLSAVGFLIGSFYDPRALIGLIAVSAVNICVQVLYRPRVEALIPAIHEVSAFLRAGRKLAAIRFDALQNEQEMLHGADNNLSRLDVMTRWLKYEPSEEVNQIVASLYTYVNMILLIDVNAFVFTINSARRARPTLQRVFNAIGYIDAAQSIAHWRSTLPHWCAPEFTREEKHLNVSDVVHPLVANAVPNDLVVNDSSVLITGSNMSGKTTFVRAVGINAILAQTVSTALATRWHAPYLRVGSSIGNTDSVLEGRSYYMAEVESIRSLVERKHDGHQHLFLIDELFRGTNTAERVAGAYGVLEYLNRGRDIVIVATHDTELLGLLGNAYAPHHFREEISPDGLSFDYIMRDGQATTRNAIALLEIMKYPAEIVDNARRILS
ncbi:MAG: hypothetical protein ABI120_10420 [Gemmatimonadaceae bacterium]